MTTQIIGDTRTDVVLEDVVSFEIKKRHVVRPHENHHLEVFFKHRVWAEVSAQELVDTARVQGIYVIALCGHKWIPTVNPVGMDTCDTCVDMMNVIMGSES